MDFALTEEQRMLQQSIEGFLETNCPLDAVRIAASSGSTRVTEIMAGLSELGVPGIIIPEEYGGVELGFLEAALISEALGAVAAPVPFVATSVMAPLAILKGGNDSQKEKYLPQLASGDMSIGVGVTEQIGRRDSEGIHSDGNKLSGRAMFVLDGMDADAYVVANTHGELYIVETPNVSKTPLKTIDKTRAVVELKFDGTEAELLPGSADNKEILLNIIDCGRVMLAADTLGASQTMLDKALAYVQERRQFNRVIGSFQAVKHMCAEMTAELEPCRSFVWYSAHALRAIPDESRLMACHAKSHLAEVGRFVSRKATECHGGMGFTDLLGLHYWFKRIGFNRQLLGSPELIREEAARIQGWI